MASERPWWHPEAHAARRPALLLRARVMAALRRFFAERDFVEVETPALQVSPGMEPHIQALATELAEPFGAARRRLYLHTSPEFAMKKLLAAGETRLFQLAHVWRDGERSALHHPEFTLLEWYRTDAGYEALMADCGALLRATAQAAGTNSFRRGARRCDAAAEPVRLTVAEAFQGHCGIDLPATAEDASALAAEARRIGLHVGSTDAWDDIFHRIMMDRIEPHLGDGAPLILCEYPVALAANARRSDRDPRVAERFELYVCGVELANAFGELTSAEEQRRRFQADMDLKERLYGVRYPIDEEFLAALALMPDCAGIALGIDRLVMLAAGAERIDDVLWAPVG